MIIRTLMVTAAVLSFPAASSAQEQVSQQNETQQEQQNASATDPAMFTALAASGNYLEIESSQNALNRLRNEDVKAFAQQMVDDHSAALESLRQAAVEEGWETPDQMSDLHRQMFEHLSGNNAENFEAEYVRAQVQAHDEAVALYQGYAENGPDGALRRFAEEHLPILQEHKQRIHELADTLSVSTNVVADPAAQQQQAAQQEDPAMGTGTCQTALTNFSQQLGDDRFWVTGWGNRWGTGTVAPTGTGTVAPTGTGTLAETPSPWTGVAGSIRSPRAQIRQLYGAAQVLAYQGNNEGCVYLVDVLSATYDNYVARLRDAGVQPEGVSGWRQEQLALAQPVTDLSEMGRLNVDDITGTDVRNLEDESLGSVSDLVIDPASGRLTYAVVARGGFLGFGEDYIAVPWERFRATPGLNTLVLDMSAEDLQGAPSIDPESFGDPSSYAQQDQRVDQFWNS